jgi:DNA-binding transcriptional ArsR family regulator
MRSEPPALLPVFRSRHQADLLTALFLHPERDYTTTELAAWVGVPLTTAHRELARLEESGLLVGRQVGRSRLLRANDRHRAFAPLAQLLLVTFGPHVVIAEEFDDRVGADRVLVYGSWAARYDGVPGPAPGDVDVLVVGPVRRAEVYAAAERAEARLGVPVNPVVRSEARWRDGGDPLVATIRSVPYLDVTSGRHLDEQAEVSGRDDTVPS